MKLPCRQILQLAVTAVALPAVRMGRARSVALLTCSTLLSGLPDLPAHADSKAAAEFTLKICSDAMEDFSKVEAAARDASWPVSSQPIGELTKKYMRNRSMWTVSQADETYVVSIWESLIRESQNRPPQKVCSISFPNKTVKRDEFFNAASAAMDLTFALDTRTPQMRIETFEINRYRPNKVNFTFMSTLDDIVLVVLIRQAHTLGVPGVQPAAPPDVERQLGPQ